VPENGRSTLWWWKCIAGPNVGLLTRKYLLKLGFLPYRTIKDLKPTRTVAIAVVAASSQSSGERMVA